MSLTKTDIETLVNDFLDSLDVNRLRLQTDEGVVRFTREETNEAITRRLTPLLTTLCDNKEDAVRQRLQDAVQVKMQLLDLQLENASSEEMVPKNVALQNEYSSYKTFASDLLVRE